MESPGLWQQLGSLDRRASHLIARAQRGAVLLGIEELAQAFGGAVVGGGFEGGHGGAVAKRMFHAKTRRRELVHCHRYPGGHRK